ncbi:MAG TPA: PSD1 and planctomycete cytochrome C domain-containing protein [Urbifossiella sp.]|nr:PSD1 and planctomycete cytochrome C domain-containing protein [Urbifossiella sp.]
MPRRFSPVALVLAFLPAPAAAADPPAKVDFAREVLPILSDTCFACHGPDAKARKADLRLDTKEDAHSSGSIVPGKSGESELFRRITSADPDEVMPPAKGAKQLTPRQIDTLKRWIDQGAPWAKHWAFDPPKRPDVPRTKFPTANSIDAFVRYRLEREGLTPAVPATKEQLIRRVTLDLTGLPPTPAAVDAFVVDPAADAYEKMVDRLLASPRFGERMAWDWLDAARYADSNGYQGDSERTMWPWRDWVVRAFNDNVPYDRFTVWQLAGDLLPNATREQVLATGFNRNHMINGEGGRIAEENRIEYVFDQAETVGTLWLGLTMTCSRCHDHKFDPITRRDYYRLFAYFNQTPVNGGGGSGQTAPVIDFSTPEQDAKLKAAQKTLDGTVGRIAPVEKKFRDDAAVMKDGKYESTLPAVIESALRKGPNGRADSNNDDLVKHYEKSEPAYIGLLKDYRKQKGVRDAAAGGIPKVMVMGDMPKARDTFILTRGAYDKHEDKVDPGVPASLPALPKGAPANRLALANWIVAPDNPLTARVTVNRIWQMLFGTGLVKTAEEFGVQGERPSHPDLLDWLAVEFVNPTGGGTPWDVKRLIRLIVTSQTYRQSSRVTAEQRERDPENRLLARGPRHRLPSWMIRDQALFASGLMTPAIGGVPVRTYQPPGIWEEATFGFKRYQQDTGAALYRRSLYVFWRRIVGPTMFFDVASRQTCAVKTTTTNTPLHALTTLNDTTFVEAARALAQRAMTEGEATDTDRLRVAFRYAVGRAPAASEVEILRGSLDRQRRLYAADRSAAERLMKVGESPRDAQLDVVEHAALTAVCTLILNLDETLTNQ